MHHKRKCNRRTLASFKGVPRPSCLWVLLALTVTGTYSEYVSTASIDSETSVVSQQIQISQSTAPDSTAQLWGVKLHDLEQKLEKDLQKVELDAHARVSSAASDVRDSFATAQIKRQISNDTLDQDLIQVKTDIYDLVESIQSAEEEISRAKAKMDNEEKAMKKKNAEMETEKILDGLHRGTLNLKVDYVTGQLVSPLKEKRRERRSAAFEEGNKSENDAGEVSNLSTSDAASAVDASTSDSTFVSAKEATTMKEEVEEEKLNGEDEKALNEIVDAAASVLKPDAANNDDDKAVTEKAKASENVIQQLEDNPDLKIRVREEIKSIRSDSDPAVLSMDFQLLLDIVKLAMTASLFGLAAVFMQLPPTAGFLMGGMLIGPSCLELIGEIHQVQTLAQFGVIFLLFEQGLLYSLTYSGDPLIVSSIAEEFDDMDDDDDEKSIGSSPTSGQSNTDNTLYSRRLGRRSISQPELVKATSSSNLDSDRDPNVVGCVVLVLLIFFAAAIVWLTEVVVSIPEAVIVSCAIAVCSTTIVSENLHVAKIADTHWGKGVLKVISMHDLFMVPLLALPELLSSVNHFNTGDNVKESKENFALFAAINILCRIGVATVFLRVSMILAKNIISAANLAEARMVGEKSELFTLSVVAYALLIATMSDQLKLSIEAGAVLAGIALMRSPYVPKVIASIAPITSVFGGMYLTSLGTILSPTFVLSHAGEIIQLVLLIGLFKLAVVATTLNRVFDYSITSSLAVGSAMAQVSEVSLLVLAKAQRIGLVSRKTYLLLIPTVFILLTLAPFSASQLRRLKIQEFAGGDDGVVPVYLCFLQNILRHPKPRNHSNPLQRSSSADLEIGSNYLHTT